VLTFPRQSEMIASRGVGAHVKYAGYVQRYDNPSRTFLTVSTLRWHSGRSGAGKRGLLSFALASSQSHFASRSGGGPPFRARLSLRRYHQASLDISRPFRGSREPPGSTLDRRRLWSGPGDVTAPRPSSGLASRRAPDEHVDMARGAEATAAGGRGRTSWNDSPVHPCN